jgi:GNAT superfamily N-acetyltransferase
MLAQAQAVIGGVQGQSYGRPVAPLSVEGQDLGQKLIRAGDALAAPSYMKADPTRSADYMQAERLARQNRLGVHDVYAQTPSDFRRNPQTSPDRETVAAFWDTPTPWAGLRPEAEQRILQMTYDAKVPLADIAEYAKANGGTLDMESAKASRDHFLKYGKAGGVEYKNGPRILTDNGDGVTGAAVRGAGTGALAGGLDEAGALVDSLGLTDGRENVFNSDRRFADIWANNQQQNSAILGYDEQESPYATTAGFVAGGLAVPFGARARTVPELFRVGAAYGAAEGFLGPDGDLGQRSIGGAIGLPLGGVLGAGAGKALQVAAPYAGRVLSRLRGRAGDEVAGLADDAARMGIQTRDEPPPPPGFVLDDAADPVANRRLATANRGGIAPDDVPPPTARFVLQETAPRGPVTANAPPIDEASGLGPRSVLDFQPREGAPGISVVNGDGHLATAVFRDENGVARGAAQVPLTPEAREIYEAASVYVDPAFRRQGIASDLYGALRREGYPIDDLSGSGNLTPDGAAFVNAARSRGADSTPPPPPGFMLMADESMPSISQDMRRPDYLFPDRPTRMDQPLTEAQRAVMAERIDPRDLTPLPSNEIGSVEEAARRDAGRYARAPMPNERAELTRQTVRAWNGAEVPKVGPIDLVGWVRHRGGLADQGGELSHMGMNNAARRGMDFVGQEARFGPLVNEQGSRLDEAAQAAWEQGYFPDHTERPTTAEFLDALRDTYEGRSRHFLPEDYAEVDRFYGAQAERQAMQQQVTETGQLFVQDRSVPVDEPQPFAPPEAYEEWGTGGGPDFAGNIRLGNLETPQDIARALSTIEQRVGFDAATRGRVSQAETARLAAELNMTPETLLARRTGQAFNAEEALAARQILAKSSNELVNAANRIKALDEPGDDLLAEFQQKLTRHVAIQEQIAGATAEAGRALQQFSMVASSNAVRKDVLSSMVQAGGGRDRIKRAADVLIEAVEGEPGKFNALVDKLGKPRFRDKLVELYINNLLTSPATHAVNMVSNTLTSLGQIPEYAVASALGGVRQALNSAPVDRVLGSEVGARAFGFLQGAKEGARLFAQAVRTGEPSDIVTKVEGQGMKAISGLKGEIIRAPTRMLTAEDELFKGIARRMEINGQAVQIAYKEGLTGEAAKARIAELSANPTDAMMERSFDYARYLTFQQKLGPVASKISGVTQAAPGLKLFLPFIRTPTNLIKFATERSPGAVVMPSWWADIASGGARRDVALAKVAVGTGLGAAIYEAALAGNITGSQPTDPVKSRLLKADGWQPYSIRIGDQYYSYKRLDPFSTTLGTAADLALLPEGMSEKQREDKVTLFVASILGNLASKTWLTGISDVVGALSEPDRKAGRMVERLFGSVLVPTGVAQGARLVDTTPRETDGVQDYVQSRIPFASRSLLPKRDLWGREVQNEGGLGPDAVSPVYTSTARNDPVNRELLAIEYAPGKVQNKVGDTKLTPQQYDRYQELAGRYRYENMSRLVTSPAWQQMNAEQRESAAERASKAGSTQARAELFGAPASGGKPKASRSQWQEAAAAINPPPPGFVVEGEAAGVNVYADIQQAIPGVRITSGYRTPEYQAEMRRRGYKPAANSAHLDGSALDLLPPEGKSMGWLRDRVSKWQKAAKILNEGDHLHVIFPGYYGAPVLGGAKAAGLRNPNMGAPPPPPGFVLQ